MLAPACGGSTNGVGTGGDHGNVSCPPVAPNNQSACTAGASACTYGDVACACGGGGTPVWTCTVCPACPTTQPTGACTPGGAACAPLASCNYGPTTCNCAAVGAGGGGDTWSCGTCPATQPAAASTCTAVELACSYDATTCTCRRLAAAETWECVTPPPMCPAAQPAVGGTCIAGTGARAGCLYGATTCRCLPAGADAGTEWSCN
jgi:hypothetical protein